MKVYTKVVYDKDDNIIEEHSYNYNGPVSQARKSIQAQIKAKMKASKLPSNLTKIVTHKTVRTSYRTQMRVPIRPEGFTDSDGPWSMRVGSGIPNAGEDEAEFGVKENVLHKFATYSTIFTLSGLSEEELESHAYLKQSFSPHDIIARTGGIDNANFSAGKYRAMQEPFDELTKNPHVDVDDKWDHGPSVNILAMGHDLFFENVNILSTVGPNAERGLANFTKMEFELHEPFGVTLVEKIRGATFTNGYLDYQDAPLLLTIEWKGWDEKGQDKTANSDGLVRKIPILITRIQFDVDQGGAKYQCVAVPYGDMAFDDRFKFPRSNLNVSTTKLQSSAVGPGNADFSWVGQVQSALKTQMKDEIKDEVREIEDEYEFRVHEDIIRMGDDYYKDLQLIHSESNKGFFTKFFNLSDKDLRVEINTVAGDIDLRTALPKFFEDAIRTLAGYQELVERFWYTWGSQQLNNTDFDHTDSTKRMEHREKVLDYLGNKNKQFEKDLEKNQFVDWFMIKPHVITTTGRLNFDNIRKVHKKKIIYYAIPMKIHILKFIKPGVSFGNINWDKYVRKNYDYIYTGNNLDVQELKIDYKSAYYMRNIRPYQHTKASSGKYDQFSQKFERSVRKIFGSETYPPPEPRLPLRQEPSVIRGRNTMLGSDPRTYKSQEFYDYLTNPQADMMKIELKILGDPAYLCQDMYTTLHKDNIIGYKGPWSGSFNSFNAEQYQPLIKVNYRLPDESNEKLGVMFEKHLSLREMLFFNGIYQVTKVESSFDSGQFTQILHCVRLNNQKGKGLSATFSDATKKALGLDKEEKEAFEPTCFHPEQLVGDKFMKDLQPGDVINGKEILGMMKLRLNEDMYSISNVKVAGSHGMKYKNEWIFVADHPDSVKINDKPEFVYIPLVRTGTFTINNEEFADYDYHDMIVLGDEEWKRRRGFQKVAQQEELTGAIN